jgi:hypothetical protein
MVFASIYDTKIRNLVKTLENNFYYIIKSNHENINFILFFPIEMKGVIPSTN